MKCAYFLFGFALLLFPAAGCQKQTAIPESTVAISRPAIQDPALADYAKKLAPILKARIKAQEEWRKALTSASTKDPNFGPALLGPPTDEYAKAVEEAESALKKLTPPPAAKQIHSAFDRLFTRLGSNLDATVAAMRSDGGDDLTRLESDRLQITEEGRLDLDEAFKDGGFDVEAFQNKGQLIVVSDPAKPTP